MYHGIINIYKEKGYTSHDVVAKLRGILKQKKIGHTGTLDPEAEGVLPVCLGVGTKLCDMLTDKDKTYRAVMLLGVVTDTQDTTGKILKETDMSKVNISHEEILNAIHKYVGSYMQTPPMYSAIKVNGKKLYELAREGIEIKVPPRSVTIYDIYDIKIELPRVCMTVDCSKGTYIRTLCNDIGNELNTGGTMEQLTRTKVSVFSLDKALKLSEVSHIMQENPKELDSYIMPVDKVFEGYRSGYLKKEAERYLYNGNSLKPEYIKDFCEMSPKDREYIKMYDCNNIFTGLYFYDKENEVFKVEKMFLR